MSEETFECDWCKAEELEPEDYTYPVSEMCAGPCGEEICQECRNAGLDL